MSKRTAAMWGWLLAAAAYGIGFGEGSARAAGESDPRDDFAVFDRAYIPALALTKMGSLEASRKAAGRLRQQWDVLRAEYADAMPGDPRWNADFAAVGKAIEGAEKQLAAGQQSAAHEALEAIREILAAARRRHGMDYHLDYLTDFHATMEEIVTAVSVEDPAQLTDDNVTRIGELTARADRQWERVRSVAFDAQRFSFDSRKQTQRRQLLQGEAQALEELAAALASGDRARIVACGKAIKPIFAKTFMMFGAFAGQTPQLRPR